MFKSIALILWYQSIGHDDMKDADKERHNKKTN